MQVKSIAECSMGAFCNTFDLSISYHLSGRTFLSIFEWPLNTDFTVWCSYVLEYGGFRALSTFCPANPSVHQHLWCNYKVICYAIFTKIGRQHILSPLSSCTSKCFHSILFEKIARFDSNFLLCQVNFYGSYGIFCTSLFQWKWFLFNFFYCMRKVWNIFKKKPEEKSL